MSLRGSSSNCSISYSDMNTSATASPLRRDRYLSIRRVTKLALLSLLSFYRHLIYTMSQNSSFGLPHGKKSTDQDGDREDDQEDEHEDDSIDIPENMDLNPSEGSLSAEGAALYEVMMEEVNALEAHMLDRPSRHDTDGYRVWFKRFAELWVSILSELYSFGLMI